jgi:hypothetical protein
MNKMFLKKKPLSKIFEVNAPRRKGLSLRRRQNGTSNHVPGELKGTKLQ